MFKPITKLFRFFFNFTNFFFLTLLQNKYICEYNYLYNKMKIHIFMETKMNILHSS